MTSRELSFSAHADAHTLDAAWHAADSMAEQIGHMLHVAAALMGQQRQVELTGLDERIGRLCAAVLDLPYEQGRNLRPRLQDLHLRLTGLTATLADPARRQNGDAAS